MLGAVSLISVVVGAAAAAIAERFPAYVEAIETAAGVLLIGGIALVGASLPVFYTRNLSESKAPLSAERAELQSAPARRSACAGRR